MKKGRYLEKRVIQAENDARSKEDALVELSNIAIDIADKHRDREAIKKIYDFMDSQANT